MRRTTSGTQAAALAALTLLGACGDAGGEGPSPQALAARQDAARTACVATELLAEAEDDLATLATTLPPEGTVQRMAAQAALSFAGAYQQHAALRVGAYAHLDSALNHSAAPADSLRYLQRARGFTLRAPEPETLEMNVVQAYEQDFARFLADADHPCNWDLPGMERRPG